MSCHILKCEKCGIFTMKKNHCNKKTKPLQPPKFIVNDKYQGLKRKAMEKERKEVGLL